jgi:putative ABC transport system permease protein
MFARYVWADLVRNPRRTLSTAVGVMLGVGLSCAILFFVDGLSASMTQRAVAPLPIDMQRVLSEPMAGNMRLGLKIDPIGPAKQGDVIRVQLELKNQGETPANEVIVRSVPSTGLVYLEGSAIIDGNVVTTNENPFASGSAKIGLNIGTVKPGATMIFEYQVTASAAHDISQQDFASTFSTREAVVPIKANTAEPMRLTELVARIETLDGISFAEQLSFADLPPGALSAAEPVDGLVRVFGFDSSYTKHDPTINIVEGSQVTGEAMISAEAARSLSVGIGDAISLALPDGSQLKARISAIVDLTGSRSLFSSRQGANLETFIYVPNALVIDSASFTDVVVPAFERTATGRGERVKSPPVREIDIGVERELLDAEPGVALSQTQRIAQSISGVAAGQDFLLDNISNTLAVARDDAMVAKRMFVFLGVPGAVLAAMLAAYAGIVLAGAQRREQATLRIRGASRHHLLSMLSMRVSCITAAGASVGVALGYATAAAVLGPTTLMRATTANLVTSAVLGTISGLLATGTALYLTGRRSIEREINEEKARLWMQPPAWRRFRLDMVGIVAVLMVTAIVVANSGFEGTPGSVYVGRAVQLPLGLLFLPISAWIAGTFFGGRIVAWILARPRAKASLDLDRPLSLLYQMSVKRRSWVLVDAAVIVGLIVALGTSLAVFTASYDGAKAADARYTLGSDLRITPQPSSERVYRAADASEFVINGIDAIAPVVYGVHNVVLRSRRTAEVANLAALNPQAYLTVAPLDDNHFSNASAQASLGLLANRPDAILLSAHMADFLQAKAGDTIRVLLARATSDQVEITMEMVGSFERLAGFPDGADALMNISRHEAAVTSTVPAFFLARTSEQSNAALNQTATALRNGPSVNGAVQIDTRLTALAKDQSSLAALNIGGLLKLDSGYSLAMGAVTIAIFVFGLLLQRRREYVTLRAQGMQPRAIRLLIGAEAGTVAVTGCAVGVPVGLIMAFYLINVLRPLFVLNPPYIVPIGSLSIVVGSVLVATVVTSVTASLLVNQLRATELLRDE